MESPWAVAAVELVEYEDAHDERTNLFVQWKGTDVCFDFYCECGLQSHYDGFFAYQIRCPGCGVIWKMPDTVYPLRLDGPNTSMAGPVDPSVDLCDGRTVTTCWEPEWKRPEVTA